jgi:1-phosphofructokinase
MQETTPIRIDRREAGGEPRADGGRSMAVFSPSPILTITVEAGKGDGPDIHLHAGGQGFWVARMAVSLGARVSLCCALGGETGRVLRALIAAEGVDVQAVDAKAANGVYIHDRRSGERVGVASAPSDRLGRHDVDELYGLTLTSGLESDITLLCGVQPESVLSADVYRRLAGDLRANGRTVLADLTGAPLAAALRGGVDLVKLSQEELLAEGRAEGSDLTELIDAMWELKRSGADSVLLSRGPLPALVLDAQGPRVRALEVVGPAFEAADPIGSGDSMFAAFAVGLANGSDGVEALRLAVAAGALNATRHGLGTGTRTEIERLSRHVSVRAGDSRTAASALRGAQCSGR